MAKSFDMDELMGEGEDKDEQLIYPINIHESLKSSGGLQQGEMTSIIVSFWIFAMALLAWFLASWLRNITQYYLWVTLLVLVVLQLTVGVYLLGFILDEKGLASELDNSDLSFINYFNVYKEILSKDSQYPFDVIEYSDGSHVVFIQCLLGYNTQLRSEETYDENVEVEQILARSGMPYRKIFTNELFRGSLAAEQLLNTVRKVNDPDLFKAYRAIVMRAMDIAENESNVLCTTYVVHAQTRIQKDELTATVEKVLAVLRREGNVYRQVGVLNFEQCVEFLRCSYDLDVLDMGMVRERQAIKKRIDCSIKLLKVKGERGKVYTTTEYDSMLREMLHEDGIL